MRTGKSKKSYRASSVVKQRFRNTIKLLVSSNTIQIRYTRVALRSVQLNACQCSGDHSYPSTSPWKQPIKNGSPLFGWLYYVSSCFLLLSFHWSYQFFLHSFSEESSLDLLPHSFTNGFQFGLLFLRYEYTQSILKIQCVCVQHTPNLIELCA